MMVTKDASKTPANLPDLSDYAGYDRLDESPRRTLRLQELETLQELSRSANAKIYVDFDPEIHGQDE